MNAEITTHGDRFRVKAPYSALLVDRFRTVPGRKFHGEDKAWSFPLVKDVVLMVSDVLGLLPWMLPDPLREVAGKDAWQAVNRIALDLTLADAYHFKTQPYDHQRRNFCRAMQNPRWLFADEQGCIHPQVMLQCQETAKTRTVEEWSLLGEMPLLAAYDANGDITHQRPSRLFVKKVDDYLAIVFNDGRMTIVGTDHQFLTWSKDGPCLTLAKNLRMGDGVASRPVVISGPESITGTISSSSRSTPRSKPTGLASFSETEASTAKAPTSNSSSVLPNETLITSNALPATSGSPALQHLTPTARDTDTVKLVCLEQPLPKLSCDSAWTSGARPNGSPRSLKTTCSDTFGEASSMPMATSRSSCKLEPSDTPPSPPLCHTLPHNSLTPTEDTSGTKGLANSTFAEDTTPGLWAAQAEGMPNGSEIGFTPAQPASLCAKPESFALPGLTASGTEDCEHVIPACCRNLSFLKVVSVRPFGRGPIYDLTMDGLGNYFDAMGINHQNTGKTHALCNRIFRLIADHPESQCRILVLCPKSVVHGWQQQLSLHAGLVCLPVEGGRAHRQLQLRADNLCVRVANYELLLHSTEDFLAVDWTMVVFDEIHRLKSFTAATSKIARELSAKAKYVYGLSGTPAPNGLEDWLGVLSALDPNLLPVSTKTAFEARYTVKERLPNGGWKVAGYRNVPELHAYISSVTSRVTKAEALDLPPKVYSTRHVRLEGEQARVYKELKRDAVARLKQFDLEVFEAHPAMGGKRVDPTTATLTVRNVLTESLRLLQVVGGVSVPDDDGKSHELADKAKVSALADILDEVGDKQVVIWCAFRPEVHWLAEWLGKNFNGKVSVLTGDSSAEERSENLRQFQEGTARFFVGTAAAGGTGINELAKCDTVVYYSRDFNYATWAQSQDRCHRIGTRSTVSIISIVALGTVDERVNDALERKGSLQEMLLADPEKIF
jgi:superfamily II DNA or RNA helicase